MFPIPFYDEQNLNIPFSRIMANPKLISVLSNSTFFVSKHRYGVNLTDANFSEDKSECTITLPCEQKDRICPNRDKCSCFKDKTCPSLLKMNGYKKKSIIDYD